MGNAKQSRSLRTLEGALVGLNRNLALADVRKLLRDLVLTSDDEIAYLRKRHLKCTERYSDERILELRDQLRYIWNPKRVPERMLSVVNDFRIEHSAGTLPEILVNAWLRTDLESRGPLFILFDGKGSVQVKPNEYSLPSLLAFGVAFEAHHLRFCENKKCQHRHYFIADRLDQKYCSSECAQPAQRAAKLKWWRAHYPKRTQLKERKQSHDLQTKRT